MGFVESEAVRAVACGRRREVVRKRLGEKSGRTEAFAVLAEARW